MPYVNVAANLAAASGAVGEDHPLYDPIVNVVAARMACSVERGMSPSYSQEDILNVERAMMLDPMGTISRYFRTVLLGAEIVGSVVTFSPQKDCIPLRLVVPSVDEAKTFFALQSGLEQYFASTAGVAGRMFGVDQCASFIRPIYTKVGNDITMRASSTPTDRGYAMVCADMSADGRLAVAGELRPMGLAGTVLASGGVSLEIKPQKDFRVRKLSLSGTLATVTLESFLVGVDPQFLSAQHVTAELLDSRVPWEVWLDADVCKVGQTITLNFASSAGDIPITGTMEGDVCR